VKNEQYQRAAEVFQEAADLEGEAQRAFLDRACSGDTEVRAYVDELLAEDTAEEDLFEESRLRLGHELLAEALGFDTQAPEPAGDTGAPPAAFPATIGRFRILEKLGEGGMGAVFLAEQDHPHRRVALKMIRVAMLSPGLRKRFRFEAEVLGRLQHPGIAQIHEAGEVETEVGPQPYFAMEYVEGVELREYARTKALDVRARLELVARIADAVHHAHQKGIVHRDLKPENVLVQETPAASVAGVDTEFAMLGQPKILDFGVARATDADVQLTTMHTEVGQLVGTLPYMSPEQVAGDSSRLDTRSDIYALGVLLYELLAGKPPFDLSRTPIAEAARVIREEEPTRLGSIDTAYRGDIDTIACKALEKDRDRRYASAADLASDIRRYLANEPIIAHPPSTFYQLKKFAQRHKGLVAGLAATLLVLVAGIIVSVTLALRAREGEKRAKRNEERALEGEAAAERNACRQSLAAAQAVGETDSLRALAHLDAVPRKLRNWEWRHLEARFNSHIAHYEGTGVQEQATTVARGPDGRLLAALPLGNKIQLIDLESGEVVADFSTGEPVKFFGLAPEGTHLAAFSADLHKAFIWKTGDQARAMTISVGERRLRYCLFSPDGKWLTVCFFAGPSMLIDTEMVQTESRSDSKSLHCALAINADGSRLLAVHGSNGHLYSFPGGKLLQSKHLIETVGCGAFSPGTKRIAIGQIQRMIRILDASTLEVLDILRGHTTPVTAVTFSPDGRYLASAALDSTVRVWDVERGETVRVFPWNPGSRSAAYALAFSRDGTLLAAGNASAARLWKWKDEAPKVLGGHTSYVYHTAYHPRDSMVASGEYPGGLVLLWDALSGDRLATFPGKQTCRYLGFTPDGDRLIVGQWEGGTIVSLAPWDTHAACRLREPRIAGDAGLLEAANPTEAELANRFFRAMPGGTKAQSGYSPGESMCTSMDGKYLIRPTPKNICLLELRDRLTDRRLRGIGKHDSVIQATAISPDGRRVVSGDIKGVLKVWDSAGGKELATLTGHTSEIYAIAYHPDGTRFASAGNDAAILVWDAKTFEQVLVLRGHTAYVHSLCFSPDGTQLVSGSGDGTVRIWDSVAPAKRWKQIREARALRRQATPLVERLLSELTDPLDVADRIRADRTLNEAQRRAALRVLLRRASAGREKRR